jgi:hypothetical protein
MGADKQFNTGRTDGICYTKTKSEYRWNSETQTAMQGWMSF